MALLDIKIARDLLISLLDADFTTLEQVERYAEWRLDREVELSEEELRILAEVATATTNRSTLLGFLMRESRRDGAASRRGLCEWEDSQIGLRILRYERDDCTLPELLFGLGRYLDLHEHPRFDCEELFALLTRLEHDEPSDEIEAELYDLVSAQIDCVRRELRLLGFTINGEFDPELLSNES